MDGIILTYYPCPTVDDEQAAPNRDTESDIWFLVASASENKGYYPDVQNGGAFDGSTG
jgi:hypothetical protein